jgi:hypothetical protein
VCTRGSNRALVRGRSTSPLGVMRQSETPPRVVDAFAKARATALSKRRTSLSFVGRVLDARHA